MASLEVRDVLDHLGSFGFKFDNVSFNDFSVWMIEGGVGFLNPEDVPTVKQSEEAFEEYLEGLEKLGVTFNNVSVENFWAWFSAGGFQFLGEGITDRYNRHGIFATIEPKNEEKLTAEVKKHRRPLSMKLEKDEGILQEALDKEAKRPRTFIRTWIRLVPRKDVQL